MKCFLEVCTLVLQIRRPLREEHQYHQHGEESRWFVAAKGSLWKQDPEEELCS